MASTEQYQNFDPKPPFRQITTAIIVDGGFYRKRAQRLFGEKSPEQRAEELLQYCHRHIKKSRSSLYRIYYYDCPPSERVVFHPFTKEQINLAKEDHHTWMTTFLKSLTKKRKVALRRGETLATQGNYRLRPDTLKKLCNGTITIKDLREGDFILEIVQKGVDMRIGLDIASLSDNQHVNQIIMISGDSDFVPAAKHARRAGIDFILDPMWSPITDSLSEHVDGIRECVLNTPQNLNDPLHVNNATSKNSKRSEENLDEEI